MSNIFQKLGSYHILANLIPGAFFVISLNWLFGISIPTDNIGEDLLVFYFIGLVMDRIGSLVTDFIFVASDNELNSEHSSPRSILKKTRFIRRSSYHEYIEAEKEDSKISALSDMNECYSSLLTCVWMLPVVWGGLQLRERIQWLYEYGHWVILVLLFLLFLLSYWKQTRYIRSRVEKSSNLKPKK